MSVIPVEEALREWADQLKGEINVCLPAVVEKYDEDTGRITARPAVRYNWILEDTDERVTQRFPAIPNVPVAFPRWGDFGITAPLAPGDHVLLVFADRSIDEYVATGSEDSTPQDVRRFDLTDAVAFPTNIAAAPGTLGPDMVVGSDTSRVTLKPNGDIIIEGTNIKLGEGATEAVLKGDAFVSALVTLFNSHTHPDPASGSTGTPSTPLTSGMFAAGKSTKVKTE